MTNIIYADNNPDEFLKIINSKKYHDVDFLYAILELEDCNLHNLDEDIQNQTEKLFWSFITSNYNNNQFISDKYGDDLLETTVTSAIRSYIASFFKVEDLLDKLEPLLLMPNDCNPILLSETCKMIYRKLCANPYYNAKNKFKIEKNLINIYKECIEKNKLKENKDGAIALNALVATILMQSDETSEYLSKNCTLNKNHWFLELVNIKLNDTKKIWKNENKNPCSEVVKFVDKILEIIS